MSLQEKIERLIEDRRAEAVKKDLPRKLKMIAKNLGFAVRDSAYGKSIEGGFGYFSSPAQYQMESELDDDELPTDPMVTESYILAYHFDGITNGINMQVNYDEASEMVRVHYEGEEVYREQTGVIECYVPSSKWETNLESLFSVAEKRAKIKDKRDRDDRRKRGQSKTTRLLEQLRKLWGI